MKKILICTATVALLALMTTSAAFAVITVPAPPFCPCTCYPPGFTPGFWKHDIEVRLGLTNGAYNAFEGGPLDGVKLTDALMNTYLADIQVYVPGLTFTLALQYLQLQGNNPLRTNTANWFNWAAGYGPF